MRNLFLGIILSVLLFIPPHNYWIFDIFMAMTAGLNFGYVLGSCEVKP